MGGGGGVDSDTIFITIVTKTLTLNVNGNIKVSSLYLHALSILCCDIVIPSLSSISSQHECFYAASTLVPSASAAAATTVAATPAIAAKQASDSPDASSMCRALLLPKGCTMQKRSPNHKLMAERSELLLLLLLHCFLLLN